MHREATEHVGEQDIAFRMNANQARAKDKMCTVGISCFPKWIFSH